jgi:hypothetical protein
VIIARLLPSSNGAADAQAREMPRFVLLRNRSIAARFPPEAGALRDAARRVYADGLAIGPVSSVV